MIKIISTTHYFAFKLKESKCFGSPLITNFHSVQNKEKLLLKLFSQIRRKKIICIMNLIQNGALNRIQII